MESRKYCAYNKTQASFLSLGITVVDTVNEPFKSQIHDLARNAPAGLWLNPCRELPVGSGLVDFDVVYLDEDFQVVEVVESSTDLPLEPPKTSAASALALPSHTIASSQTQCGDELIIWTTDGTGQKSSQTTKSVAHALKRLVPSPAEEDSEKPQPTSEQLDDREKPSLMARLKVWTAAKTTHRVADIPPSIAPAPTIAAPTAPAPVAPAPAISTPSIPAPVEPTPVVPVRVIPSPITPAPVLPAAATPAPVKPAPVVPVRAVPEPITSSPVTPAPITPPPARPPAVTQSTESIVANRAAHQAGFTLSPPAEDSAKRPAAIQPLQHEQQAEPEPEYRPSLMSRYKTWAAEKAAHQAADTPISIVPARSAPTPPVPTPIVHALVIPTAVTPAPAKPAPVPQSDEFLVTKPATAQAGFTLSPASHDAAKPPAAIGIPKVEQTPESEPHHRPSLVSRYKTWAAEKAAHRAADSPISIAPASATPAPTDPAPVVLIPVAGVPVAPPARVVPAPITPAAVAAAPVKPTPITPVPLTPAPVAPTPVKSGPFLPSSETLFAKKPRAERYSGESPAGHVTAKPQATVESSDDKQDAESVSEEKPSLRTRLLRWLNNPRPVAQRQSKPGLVAYYWTGGPPQAHEVVNISATGLYVRTREHWLPDTVILMTLQRIGSNPDNPEDSVSVLSKVIRQDEDGVGLEFVTSESAGLSGSQFVPGKGKDKDALQKFMRRMKSRD